MEKSAAKLNCYYKKVQKWLCILKKKETEDIDEQRNRNCSYLMRGYRRGLKSKWRTKEKKYECISKIVLFFY